MGLMTLHRLLEALPRLFEWAVGRLGWLLALTVLAGLGAWAENGRIRAELSLIAVATNCGLTELADSLESQIGWRKAVLHAEETFGEAADEFFRSLEDVGDAIGDELSELDKSR